MIKQFNRIVQNRRVAGPLRENRKQPIKAGAEQFGTEQPLPRSHPVQVAAQRIDLAVMTDEAERLGQWPRRKRVGAVALMDERQSRGHPRITQFRVEVRHPERTHQSFVDEGPGRTARQIKSAVAGQSGTPDLVFRHLARDKELPVKTVARHTAASDKDLADNRQRAASQLPHRFRTDRHIAPCQYLQAFSREAHFERPLAARAAGGVLRKEDHAHSVRPGLGKSGDLLAEKSMRHLQQNACAIPRVRIIAGRAAVLQIGQHVERLDHDVMGFLAAQAADHAHAAGIPLEGRIIQTVLRRPTFFLFVPHSHLMPLPAAIASSRRSGDDGLPTDPGRCAQAHVYTPHARCRRHTAR
ncbi:MAG: hypothetical protein BWX70_01690 [Verrucomicrobia bacterium ADurb.Bin070]|nr:MAG: hypothetical protein BWX70_01690 [Verrucomicrobia bacterium ADurb.Bin070]